MDYVESMALWLDEIKSEVEFWDRLFATQGKEGGDPEVFNYRTNPECPFQIPEELDGEDNKVLDVGSGPYSNLGYIYNKKRVDLTLVDPLACVYKKLESKYGYKFCISPRTGMVEWLNMIIPENEYDLVHMSNSLDHSFDPIEGIRQLLYVTRIGGKVVLRHHNNCAEQAHYQGLHQWNLTVENGHFIIWNKKSRIDMNEYLSEYAEVEFAGIAKNDTIGREWEYVKIILRKRNTFELAPKYAADFLVSFCEKIAMLNYNAN